MVRYAARRGVRVIGATLGRAQAKWDQKAVGARLRRPRAGAGIPTTAT